MSLVGALSSMSFCGQGGQVHLLSSCVSCCTLHSGGYVRYLNKVKALTLPRPKREQPIGKHRVRQISSPALPLPVLRSFSSPSPPLHLLLSKLLIAKGTLVSRTIVLPQISGALGEFPNFIFSSPRPLLRWQLTPFYLCRELLWNLLQSSPFGMLVS